MKKQLFLAASLLLGVFFVSAQDKKNKKETVVVVAEENGEDTNIVRMTASGWYAAWGVKPGALHKKDLKFLMNANSNNLMAQYISEFAANMATDPTVKEYARKMVLQHTQTAKELKELLAAKGAMIPDTSLLSGYRTRMDMLNAVQGADYDRTYLRLMKDAHEEDYDEYEDEAHDAKDAEVRAFAARRMPELKDLYIKSKELYKRYR